MMLTNSTCVPEDKHRDPRAPREYLEHEPGYYAVFFLDPDGIKLEYVLTNDHD
jgi:hypothetical protein